MAIKQHHIYWHMITIIRNLKRLSTTESLYRYNPDLRLPDRRFLSAKAIKHMRWFTRNNATAKHSGDFHSKAPRPTNKTTINVIS